MVNVTSSPGCARQIFGLLTICVLLGGLVFPSQQSIAQDCSCGAPCNISLNDQSLFGIEDLIACLTIEVGPNVIVEDSADVTFSAGESIIMNNDVLVSENAAVALAIDPLLFCDVTEDLDSDLSDACLDCDDDNSAVFPGATEVCDGLDNDCDKVTDEDSCDDGLSCTADICDGESCTFTPENALCNDGFFCNGAEICDLASGCVSGTPPCPGPDGDGNCAESCNEAGQNCTANDPDSSGCDDGNQCTSGDTCFNGSCTGTPIVDAYESNDTRATASILGSIDDDDEYPSGTAAASLYEAGDADWYRFHVTDTPTGNQQPRVYLTNIPSGSNYQLCTYFECDDPGDEQDVTCTQGLKSSYEGIPGCCSTSLGSLSESVSFEPRCDNSIIADDTSGQVYIRVYNAITSWTCDEYSLQWGDDQSNELGQWRQNP